MIKNFSKFLCLVEPRIFICLNREKIWLELSTKFNWCSMRSFHKTLVGFNNLWMNLSFKGFKWVSMSINLANLSKWRAKLGVWEAVFHSNSRENFIFYFQFPFWYILEQYMFDHSFDKSLRAALRFKYEFSLLNCHLLLLSSSCCYQEKNFQMHSKYFNGELRP